MCIISNTRISCLGMGVCLFFGCNSNSEHKETKKVSQFEIPKNKNIAKLWYQRSKRGDITFEQVLSKLKSYRVCALHFEPHEIKSVPWGNSHRNVLVEGAIPRPATHSTSAFKCRSTLNSCASSSSTTASSSNSSTGEVGEQAEASVLLYEVILQLINILIRTMLFILIVMLYHLFSEMCV